jgi:hypothetical protein
MNFMLNQNYNSSTTSLPSTNPNSASNLTTNNNNNINSNNNSYSSINNTQQQQTNNNSATGANNNNNNMNTNSSTSNSLSYIVNTITNEIVELKFPDEASRNQWATLVHTHITPFIGGG